MVNTNTIFPGGKREPGETDAAALYREIKEELSIDLITETVQFAGTFKAQAHGHPTDSLAQMICYTAAYSGTLQADANKGYQPLAPNLIIIA